MADSNSVNRLTLWLMGAFLIAALLKGWLLSLNVIPFNADEAIVALMARHILAGERPVFFYGQSYLGSLDAWFVALGFVIFGQQVWVIRLVQALLYLGTIGSTVVLGRQVFGSAQTGVLAGWLLAIPTVNVTLYTTASLGGYGEALLLGNLILIIALRIGDQIHNSVMKIHLEWFLWGLLVGLGWWVFGLTLIYSLPAGIFLLWRMKRPRQQRYIFLWMIFGLVIGSSPWWIFAFRQGVGALISELGGGAIAGVERVPYLLQILQHLGNLFLLGSTVTLGFRPPWETSWLGLPLLPFVLLFWLVVFLHTTQRLLKGDLKAPVWLLAAVPLSLALAFIFTPFGADPSGRYFLPLAVPLALFAADWLFTLKDRLLDQRLVLWRWGLIVLVLGYHLWGIVQCATTYPPGLTTQFSAITQVDQRKMPDLIAFLRDHGERLGYTNYWVSYPLAFQSSEELIFVPRLPYHADFRYTDRDDRYAPYDDLVDRSDRVAYITTRHPQLDEYLSGQFSLQRISWNEAWIGDFHVFYNLSIPIKPQDIGLGERRP